MANKRQINLLQTTSFEHSTVGKLVSWASDVGRWIVVLTEFIVISAFLSRFYFDTKLANLFDDVRQKKAIVSSSLVFEEQYRQAQNKLTLAKIVISNNKSSGKIVDLVSSLIPLDTTLNSLSIDVDSLTISGYTLSPNGLQTFINGLASSKDLEQLSVGKLSTRMDGLPGIDFSISAKVINSG